MPVHRAVAATVLVLAVAVSGCSQQREPAAAPDPSPASAAAAPNTPTADGAQPEATLTAADLIGKVQGLIARHWPHLHSAWPDVDYTRHALVLAQLGDDGTVADAWLADTTQTRRLTPSETAALTVPEPGGYAAATVDGRPSVVMTMDSEDGPETGDGSITYRIATHELVHFYYQDQIPQTEPSGRTQGYPIDATPRLYRAMLYRNLIAAYDDPANADVSLRRAKYWHEKWQAEYPDEARDFRDPDIAEGTARYIEILGTVVGDSVPGAQRDKRLGEAIPRDETFTSAEGESYELGLVAGLLLDRTTPTWKDGFLTRGTTLVDELLAGFSALPQEPDPQVQAEITRIVAEVNEQAATELADILRARTDTTVPMLKVVISDVEGSFQSTGQLMVGEDDVATGMVVRYDAGGGTIDLRGLPVQNDYDDTTGEMSLLIPLTMAHTVTAGKLSVDADTLAVEDVAVSTSQQDGRTVHTVTATG
ncbi:MAG TPA: hypothetical protein GXZ60_00695 [Intrasporangiaceae bacterium]|nr:hypothetical protein [Intrasporangiaceae bacterium]